MIRTSKENGVRRIQWQCSPYLHSGVFRSPNLLNIGRIWISIPCIIYVLNGVLIYIQVGAVRIFRIPEEKLLERWNHKSKNKIQMVSPNPNQGSTMANHRKLQLYICFLLLLSTVHSEHWYDIGVMLIRTKTFIISAVAIYTSLQPIICQFMTKHTEPWVTHTMELLL